MGNEKDILEKLMRKETRKPKMVRPHWGSLECVYSCSSLLQFPAPFSFNSSLPQTPSRRAPKNFGRGLGRGSNRHIPRTSPHLPRTSPQIASDKMALSPCICGVLSFIVCFAKATGSFICFVAHLRCSAKPGPPQLLNTIGLAPEGGEAARMTHTSDTHAPVRDN